MSDPARSPDDHAVVDVPDHSAWRVWPTRGV